MRGAARISNIIMIRIGLVRRSQPRRAQSAAGEYFEVIKSSSTFFFFPRPWIIYFLWGRAGSAGRILPGRGTKSSAAKQKRKYHHPHFALMSTAKCQPSAPQKQITNYYQNLCVLRAAQCPVPFASDEQTSFDPAWNMVLPFPAYCNLLMHRNKLPTIHCLSTKSL